MTTRPDPSTPEVPQETPDGPQERPEGGSATPAPPEGSNGPQNGTQPRGPVDWARQQAADRATAHLFAALHQSAEQDLTRVIQLADQWATRPERADALRELTDALGYTTGRPRETP